MIVPVTRATIVLIEVGSCARALWTRPKPTTSVTQANASITTLRCVRRLSASSEKLFKTCSPKDVPVISRSEPAEGSGGGLVYLNKRFRSARDGDVGAGKGW